MALAALSERQNPARVRATNSRLDNHPRSVPYLREPFPEPTQSPRAIHDVLVRHREYFSLLVVEENGATLITVFATEFVTTTLFVRIQLIDPLEFAGAQGPSIWTAAYLWIAPAWSSLRPKLSCKRSDACSCPETL